MGGAEVFTYEVAKRLAASGHNITLFTSSFSGSKSEETVEGIKVVRAGGRFTVYRQAKKFYQKRFCNEGFDVVIDEINTRPFFANRFVERGEQVFALIHQLAREYWFYETPFPINYVGYHYLENKWLRRYRDLPTITVSKSTQKDLADLDFNHVWVIPEGLNFQPLSRLPPKNPKPTVVFSGRLRYAKRPDHVIKAFKFVKAHIPHAQLWIIGDGGFRPKLERMAGTDVTFFGHVDSLKRRDLIEQSWVLVNPSVREGWGLNVIEANALGCPCVAYNAPGLRDSIVDNVTGLLARSDDIGDLSKKIVRLLSDTAKREELSEAALKYSNQFSWDGTTDEFLKVLLNQQWNG